MSTINRPTASNYTALENMRNTLADKPDSVFSYQNVNPYSVAFDKFQQDKNPNLDTKLWQEASKKGELDQYIGLLSQSSGPSAKLAELKDKYGDRLDYDTAMLALAYDTIPDDKKEKRYDSEGNLIGDMTERELIDRVLTNQSLQWDNELLEEAKRSGNFWQKTGKRIQGFGTEVGAGILDILGQANEAATDMANLGRSGFMTIVDVFNGHSGSLSETFDQIAETFTREAARGAQQSGEIGAPPTSQQLGAQAQYNISAELQAAAYDIRRKYSRTVDAVTGEYSYWGEILHGVGSAVGYMALAFAGMGPAGMYLPMFTRNVRENYQMTGYNTNYSKLISNAAVKTSIEFGIEWSLGKLVGFSGLDRAIGFTDDVARIGKDSVIKGLTATNRQALGMVAARTAKDMFKEGVEETLQEASGMFIDYLYGDQYTDRAKEGATLKTFTNAFVIGAATSFAIGSFQNMVTTREIGVNAEGLTYKMGKFQSIAYKQAVNVLAQWQQIATDPNADINTRINTALKLQGVVATLGNVYESLGVEDAINAEKLLLEVQQYHEKQTTRKKKVETGSYVESLLSSVVNTPSGSNWVASVDAVTKASGAMLTDMVDPKFGVAAQHRANKNKSVAYTSFTKAINSIFTQKALEDSGVDSMEEPVDLTDPANVKPNTNFETARNMGFNVVVRTNGKNVVIDHAFEVLFLPESMTDSDIQGLLKEVATQRTIRNILKNIPAELLEAVVKTYTTALGEAASHFSEAELTNQAIAALMFSKDFQLKLLMESNQGDNTWGTTQSIDFIKNLQKMVAKTYTKVETTATETAEQVIDTPQSEIKVGDILKYAYGVKGNDDIVEVNVEVIEIIVDPAEPGTIFHVTRVMPGQLGEGHVSKKAVYIRKNAKGLESTLPRVIKTTAETGKPKKVLSDISKAITERVIKSVQEALVIYNLTVARSTPEDLQPVLTPAQFDQVEADPNYQFSTTLDAIKNGTVEITPTIENLMTHVATDLLTDTSVDSRRRLQAISQGKSLTTVADLSAHMLNIIATGTDMDKLDLGSLLTMQYVESKRFVASKLVYIPLTKSNRAHFTEGLKLISQIEKTLLGGQSVADFIEGKVDWSLLAPEITQLLWNSDENRPMNLSGDNVYRFMQLSAVVKKQSSSKYSILQNGHLIKIDADFTHLAKPLKNLLTTKKLSAQELMAVIEQLQSKAKNGVLRLQDFFEIDLGTVGETVVAVNIGKSVSGYNTPAYGFIHLEFASSGTTVHNLMVLLHEMIHAVNSLGYADLRYNTVGGGPAALSHAINQATAFTPNIKTDLLNYIKKNFRMHYDNYSFWLIDSKEAMLGKVLYSLLYEESTARSVSELFSFTSIGFTYSMLGDSVYLVSPDGKVKWLMKKLPPLVEAPFIQARRKLNHGLLKNKISARVGRAYRIANNYMTALLDPNNNADEIIVSIRELFAASAADGINTLHEYNTIVENIIHDVSQIAPTVDQAILADEIYAAASFVKSSINTGMTLDQIKNAYDTGLLTDSQHKELLNASPTKTLSDGRTIKNVDTISAKEGPGSINKFEHILEEVYNNYTDFLISIGNILQDATQTQDATLRAEIQAIAAALQLAAQNYYDQVVAPIGLALTAHILLRSVISYDIKRAPFEATDDLTPKSSAFESQPIPDKFTFGEYSIVKHTGRTWMVTKQLGNGRYINQEVYKDTLLPLNKKQSPVIADKAMREKFLFVIAKKIEVAQKTPLTRPDVPQTKSKQQDKVIFQWGPWVVKEYDAEHYLVSKRAQDERNDYDDEFGQDEEFQQIQVVSKKTLLPETMLGSVGSPILSKSERANLLDWIANSKEPFFAKREDVVTGKEKIKYIPNLTKQPEADKVATKQSHKLTPEESAQYRYSDLVSDNFPPLEVMAFLQNYGKYVSADIRAKLESKLPSKEQLAELRKEQKSKIEKRANLAYSRVVNNGYKPAEVDYFLQTYGEYVSDEVRADLELKLAEDLTPKSSEFAARLKATPPEGLQGKDRYNKDGKIKPEYNKWLHQTYKNKRVALSKTRAAKSNLQYWYSPAAIQRRQGRPPQIHTDIIDFIEGTTAEFNKLSKFFRDRIKAGTLTHHDITEYVSTTASINDYTWKALAEYIYHNDVLASIDFDAALWLTDSYHLQEFVILGRMLKDEAEKAKEEVSSTLTDQLDLLGFKTLFKDWIMRLRLAEGPIDSTTPPDPVLEEKHHKLQDQLDRWAYYGKDGKIEFETWEWDEKQILPIFMRHFNGTLSSLLDIFTLLKTQVGKQTLQIIDVSTRSADHKSSGKQTKIQTGTEATTDNTSGVKRKQSVWNWLDKLRKNEIEYDFDADEQLQKDLELQREIQEQLKALENLSDDDAYNYLYNYLYNQAGIDDLSTEQDRYQAIEDLEEKLANMSRADINKAARAIVGEARNIAPTITATAPIMATEDTAISEEPVISAARTRKSIKDGLRNRLRALIKRVSAKVDYNSLPPEVQKLLTRKGTTTTQNVAAYTELSNEALIELSEKVAAENVRLEERRKMARNIEAARQKMLKDVEKLHKQQEKLRKEQEKVAAQKKANKEGANLRSKINITYTTKIDGQEFTINGPTEINQKLLSIFNRVWKETTVSNVKFMDEGFQTEQNVHTAKEFFAAHSAEISAMTLAEIEDVASWLIHANIDDTGVARQTFEATRLLLLAYIYNETGTAFGAMNNNLKQEIGNFLKTLQSSAGTQLSLAKQIKDKLNPVSVMAQALFANFDVKLTEEEEARLDQAIRSGNTVDLTQVLSEIKVEALKRFVPEHVSAARKIVAIRSMSMVSGPMTWVRNIISNTALKNLNPIADRIGQAIFPKLTAKTEATPTQYTMKGKITPEIQKYVIEQFVDSGLFNETLDHLSKYNPAQVLRLKNADAYDVLNKMFIKAIYNQYYSESMFENKTLNQIHKFLMNRLSDKRWVREAAIKYIGKLLAETGHHLDADGHIKTGVDDDVMKIAASAFGLATADYMHSDNFFSHIDTWLSQKSQVGWIAFKAIMPFATASWNWFKAAVRYSPIGLGQAIVRLTHLEQDIMKREQAWQDGTGQVAPELASYLVRRDLGAGIIGSIAFGFGLILAALGKIGLEDDDWGTPKLVIGDLHIDISSIFGSSSVLAGAAFMHVLKTKDMSEALDAMMEPLAEGFFFIDLLQLDANSPRGLFELGKYQAQSIALSFIPSMVRYISGTTYTGNYRTSTFFERAVTRLPYLGQAFNVPKRTDIYTGDANGDLWDIVHRLVPYFEVVAKSQAQTNTEAYGLSKEELNGTYRINDVPFKVDTQERARINQLYGMLNADALTDFYANKTTYKVKTTTNTFATKRYSQMTPTEISNALDQIFTTNSTTAKISAWLTAGHKYYTNNQALFNQLRSLGYKDVFLGSRGFVE